MEIGELLRFKENIAKSSSNNQIDSLTSGHRLHTRRIMQIIKNIHEKERKMKEKREKGDKRKPADGQVRYYT